MPPGSDGARGRAFICPHCHKPATAVPAGSTWWDGRAVDGMVENPPVEWTLVQCAQCRQPSVELREDYGEGFEMDEPVIVYPAPHRISPNVPGELRREWEE